MAKYSKEQKLEHIERVKRVLAKEPNISVSRIVALIRTGQRPLPVTWDYINGIVAKIRRQRIYRMDYYRVKEWLAEFENVLGEANRHMWNIITNQQAEDKDKIAAVRALRENSVALFDKMFDAGIFERKLGEMVVKGKLDEGDKMFLDKALKFARFGYGNSIGRKDNN